MARDGSGNFSLAEAAFVNGTTIDADVVNSDLSDIAAGLTQSMSKDGQTVPTANQPMAGFKHTGVGVASARTDYARTDQVIGSVLDYAIDTGTATAYAIAPSPGISAYVVGQRFAFKAINANSGTAPTLAVNGLTAGVIFLPDGTALAIGDIAASSQTVVQVATVAPTFHLQTPTAGVVRKSGTQTITGAKTFSATLTMSGAAINEAARADVASNPTCSIGAAASNYVRITGTSNINKFDSATDGVRRQVVFAGILTLSHNASFNILPTGASITTAAGDTALFICEGADNWRCEDYQRADGTPLVQYAPPQRAYFYGTVAAGALTLRKNSALTVARTGAGLFTCTLSPAMPDAFYRVCATTGMTLSGGAGQAPSAAEDTAAGARSTTTFYLITRDDSIGTQDPDAISIEVFA